MTQKSYDSLDKQVRNMIIQLSEFDNPDIAAQTRFAQGRLGMGATVDTKDLSSTMDGFMSEFRQMIKPWIQGGLGMHASNPYDLRVKVDSGAGYAYGRKHVLERTSTIAIPVNSEQALFYINLWDGKLDVETIIPAHKLNVGKVVIPSPGVTAQIADDRDYDNLDGYIVSSKDTFFNSDDSFDDDSKQVIRDVIGEITFEKISGDLILTQNVRVRNAANSLNIDSEGIQIFHENGKVASEMNKAGTFFYNEAGLEFAHYTKDEARIGNIVVETNAIQSGNFVQGSTGFQIKDNGDVEFNNLTVRGTVYATAGEIGGWSISSDSIYSTSTGSSYITGGTYRTSSNAGAGANGVIVDIAGVRGYSATLGTVFNLPTDGSPPEFSSGIIRETTFEVQNRAVIRTSADVGSGSTGSNGILINDTGMYGCGYNQDLADANFKILSTGDVYLKGEIVASSGQIGSVTITPEKLSGGLIEGATIVAPIIETSSSLPKIRIDETGMYYQVTSAVGKYSGFKYNSGTVYGAGVLAYLMNTQFPVLAILAEQNLADIRLYNRSTDPAAGTHVIGDLIMVGGQLKKCSAGGTPGTFSAVGGISTLTDLADTPGAYTGAGHFIAKVNSGADALEFANIDYYGLNDFKQTSLADPGEDAIVFWDDTNTQFAFMNNPIGTSILISGAGLHLKYNATNLKITSDEINTIQDISTTASPTFGGLVVNGNIDFNENQALEMRFENRSTDPTGPSTGQVWLRTDI
ncbi:MAG TPA: hypothetical protein VMW91_01075 [Desulfosporosinus sp.]|nr:hypothetical protein [Desulfosporosinus sp.]